MSEEKREVLKFSFPIPSGEERLPTDVPQLAVLLKLLKEFREAKSALEAAANRLLAIKEILEARGEVLPLKVEVNGEAKCVEPGHGMWRQVNIYNHGPDTCVVKLNRMNKPSVTVEADGSKSWTFMTEAIERVYVVCDKGKKAFLELEFLR